MTAAGSPERLEPRIRPLTEAERDVLRGRIRDLRSGPAAARRATWLAGGGVVLVLWALTLLASDAPWPVATAFWLVAGAVILLWVGRDLGREGGHVGTMADAMEGALARDEAESYDIAADSYAVFEEWEDEGACYAFDLGDGRIAFATGQEFYLEDGFPSLDFSIVYPLDEAGHAADMWIEKRGEAVPPARTIPAEVKWELAERIPEHLGVVRTSLARLEETLRDRG